MPVSLLRPVVTGSAGLRGRIFAIYAVLVVANLAAWLWALLALLLTRAYFKWDTRD